MREMTKRLSAVLLAAMIGAIGMQAQVAVRLMDGSEFQAELRGYVNGNLIRLYNPIGASGATNRTAYMAVTGVDRLLFPDGCEMVFGGQKLSLEGIRNIPGLSHWGSTLIVEGTYKLAQPEINALLGDDLYKKYKANKYMMTAGTVSLVLGSMKIFETLGRIIMAEVTTDVTYQAMPEKDYSAYGTFIVENLFKNPWGIASTVLFTGGITCIIIANGNIKHLLDDYNLGLAQNGLGLSFRF